MDPFKYLGHIISLQKEADMLTLESQCIPVVGASHWEEGFLSQELSLIAK